MNRLTKEELRDIILEDNLKYEQYERLTDMSRLFYRNEELKEIPLLDTSKVTNMESTFFWLY